MNKFTKIAALLAVSLEMKKPLFGGEGFVVLKESQLQTLEEALTKEDTSALQKELASLQEEKTQWLQEAQTLQETTQKALERNGLKGSENIAENISLLGEKCEEYGNKQSQHSLPLNDGKEPTKGEFEGIVNMNDAHNQI